MKIGKLDNGIKEQDRENIAQSLSRILADTYILTNKTQSFHWNVRGVHFHDLHKLFEAQYEQLHGALDTLAERVRALGFMAPGSLHSLIKLSTIPEQDKVPPARAMVQELLEGHETMSRGIRSSIESLEGLQDYVTDDLLTLRLAEHEKAAWMLRSILED